MYDSTSITNFSNAIERIDWECVTREGDTEASFTIFHNKILKAYNASFPKKRFKRSYHDKKPWLTTVLKESIKTKNKLYIKSQYKKANPDIMHKYKQYRNKLNHLLRIGEKEYLKEQLWKHKSNMRKTWEVIKNVINKSRNSTIKTIFHVNNVKTSDQKWYPMGLINIS